MPVRAGIALILMLLSFLLLLGNESPRPLPRLARQIVNQSAGIVTNDLVHLVGTTADSDLLEELAVAVRKQGAHPLISIGSDRLKRRFIADVPAKFDDQTPGMDLLLAKQIDAMIAIEATDEGSQLGLSPARMATQQKAAEIVGKTLLRRNVRTVYLGNGLYPTAARAKRFDMSVKELRQVYEAGLSADPRRLQQIGEAVRKTLSTAKELHLTSKSGTDLRVNIEKRPILAGDGLLTPAKRKKGGADVVTWLPAGEVYVTPVKNSGDGIVVAPLAYWEGERIHNLKLRFKAGRLVEMTAEKGADRLKQVYKEGSAGKELLGAIDIGINPEVKCPLPGKLVSYVASGMVTVALGNNTWAGGDVGTAFGISCHLGDATLKVDGKVLVEAGKLNP